MKTDSQLNPPRLRAVGQSLDEVLHDRRKELVESGLLAGLVLAMMMNECWRQQWALAVSPWPFLAAGAAVLAYCGVRWWRVWDRARRIKLARDDEREVGLLLENLRADGYSVFHDLVAGEFNVEHVAV